MGGGRYDNAGWVEEGCHVTCTAGQLCKMNRNRRGPRPPQSILGEAGLSFFLKLGVGHGHTSIHG